MEKVTIKGKLLHPYYVDIDEHQYILYRIKEKNEETGKIPPPVVVGYYTHFENVIQNVIRLKTLLQLSGEVVDIKQYLKTYSDMVAGLKNLFR